VIVGGGALKIGHGAALALVKTLAWSRTAGTASTCCTWRRARMGGLMLGYAQKGGIADIVAAKPKLVFFLGADEVDFSAFADSFKVYIGHHGDKGAHAADVILPGASYAEKPGTYVNLEGRVQRGERAVFPPGDAREDWTILRALSDAGRPAVRQLERCAPRWAPRCPTGRRRACRFAWSIPKLPPRPRARSATRSRIST
jgi:NADH-quinone oxidoreductase subunit G